MPVPVGRRLRRSEPGTAAAKGPKRASGALGTPQWDRPAIRHGAMGTLGRSAPVLS